MTEDEFVPIPVETISSETNDLGQSCVISAPSPLSVISITLTEPGGSPTEALTPSWIAFFINIAFPTATLTEKDSSVLSAGKAFFAMTTLYP
jgi:hypothetical protein